MGFFKKVFKKAKKTVKKVAKAITKPIKKVAKKIVDVGKKIVDGVKSGIKKVGKSLSKLGPLASIALMAIPGFQVFAAGLASSLGFTSAIAAKITTGALTGFITSGGDLKATVMGGAMAGAGSYFGDVAKGVSQGASVGDAFAKAGESAMASSGVSGLSQGLEMAKAEWGNFTDQVGDFLGTNSANGDITSGTTNFVDTMDKYGMTPEEYKDTFNEMPPLQQNEYQQMLSEQTAEFYETPTVPEGTPEQLAKDWGKVTESLNIDPQGQQAEMLAQQQFGYDGVYDKQMAFAGGDALALTAESGAGGTPEMTKQPSLVERFKDVAKAGAKSLLDRDDAQMPDPLHFTSGVSPIQQQATGITAAGGAGGTLGFTQEQRELQKHLVAQAEAQAERARKQAMSGWGLA